MPGGVTYGLLNPSTCSRTQTPIVTDGITEYRLL